MISSSSFLTKIRKIKRLGIKNTALKLDTNVFDFSSQSKWDQFYVNSGVDESFEWHSSISLEDIASYVKPGSNCLMVGCGNSKLPALVLSKYHHQNRPTSTKSTPPRSQPRLVLLDTSQTCVDQLQQLYNKNSTGDVIINCVCGDATQLSTLDLFLNDGDGDDAGAIDSSSKLVDDEQDDANVVDTDSSSSSLFDIIIDKGLTDVILCNEGWNGPLEKVYKEASKILKSSGKYLLISYKLPSSTKEFLTNVAGNNIGLDWELDIPSISNDRVSVSIATKR